MTNPQSPAVERIRKALEDRITSYLASGGLFNPELANHDAVRDLLIDCRSALTAHDSATAALRAKEEECERLKRELDLAHGSIHNATASRAPSLADGIYDAARAVIGATDARKD